MATLQEITDRAVQQARQVMQNPPATLELTANSLLRQLVFGIAHGLAAQAATAPLVEETVTVSLTNGAGTLPAKVLVASLPKASVSLASDAGLARKVRYLPWRRFVRPLSSRYGAFSVKGGAFYLVRPNSADTPSSGLTGSVSLTAACAPDLPADAITETGWRREIEELAVERLAEILAGERKAA